MYIYKRLLLTFLNVLRGRLDSHTFIQVPITPVLFKIPSFKRQTSVYILTENVGGGGGGVLMFSFFHFSNVKNKTNKKL